MTASWREWQQQLDVLLRHVDWHALGAVYFHRDGERLLRARQAAIVQHGEGWARAAGKRLPRGGRSLWVGAGLGDLPAMLAEVLLQERSVLAANLRQREVTSLSATLRKIGLVDRLAIVCGDAADLVDGSGGYDHLAAVGLFTDPETWPLLSAVTYGRVPPVQLDVEAFVQQREQARALAARLWSGLSRPGLVTTTAEEAPWHLEQAAAVGASIDAEDDMIPSAIIGDPIGILRVR